MADMNQIHAFAVKWMDQFKDQRSNSVELAGHSLADDGAALGFEMDCGHAFESAYGDAFHHSDELEKVISSVTDIPLLGSAICSRWVDLHQSCSGDEILKPEDRAWFLAALGRLALLSSGNPLVFQGTAKKMRIISNDICYGPCPSPEDEVEQRLTVNNQGRVWLSSYAFGGGFGKYKKIKAKNFSIDPSAAKELLNQVAACFSQGNSVPYATDIGDWAMELTNTDGRTYPFSGSLDAHFKVNGTDLSDAIRDTLGLPGLYVFDGNR